MVNCRVWGEINEFIGTVYARQGTFAIVMPLFLHTLLHRQYDHHAPQAKRSGFQLQIERNFGTKLVKAKKYLVYWA